MQNFFAFLLKNDVSASEAIMNILIGLACIAIIISMWRLHNRNGIYKNFNLVYLIVNKDGFPDGAKCMEMAVLLVMTWGFVQQVLTGKLSDAYTAAYVGAFAMRGAYGAFLRNKGGSIEPEGTTTITSTQTTTKEVSSDAPKIDTQYKG